MFSAQDFGIRDEVLWIGLRIRTLGSGIRDQNSGVIFAKRIEGLSVRFEVSTLGF